MKAIVKGAVIGGAGALLLGASLALSSATVVSGANRIHPEPAATFPSTIKCSKSGTAYCFTVQNTSSGNAIKGQAGSGIGVYGLSKKGAGVYGLSQSVNSAGVWGYAPTSSDGVYGHSSSGTGVLGSSSSGAAVLGDSGTGYGVYGESASNYAVYGYSVNGGAAGYFEKFGPYCCALYAKADNPTDYPFEATNSKTGGYFTVDYDGNGYFSGSVTAPGGFSTIIRSRNGANVGAFNSESTRAMIEDTGTARLTNGEGAVRFDSALASAIDIQQGYQVFLTPDGDTRGLYVSAKYEGGFIVRENERGRSSVNFDYRVVAHPYGASDARLPQLNLKAPPIPHVQPRQP